MQHQECHTRSNGPIICGGDNIFLEAGTLSVQALLGDIRSALYVSELTGYGVNLVTEDYSRGVSGMWIDNGELAYPVQEITIGGNLNDMYLNISAVADNLALRSAASTPTIRLDGMTIAGI